MDLADKIKKDISDNKIMLYMKGTKEMPMCGFSSTVVNILNIHEVEYKITNVLEDHNEGTETHEVEKSFLLMSRESDYVTNLQKALHRIDSGTYGICEIYQDDSKKCECPDSPLIPEERLLEVPNATKGVFCKEKKKLNLL